MDGIFCAYHNVARVFGFQYFGLEEIDADEEYWKQNYQPPTTRWGKFVDWLL